MQGQTAESRRAKVDSGVGFLGTESELEPHTHQLVVWGAAAGSRAVFHRSFNNQNNLFWHFCFAHFFCEGAEKFHDI